MQLRRRGNRSKRTSNQARTRDLCSNTELQPHKPRNRSFSFVSHRPLLCQSWVCQRLRPLKAHAYRLAIALCSEIVGLNRTVLALVKQCTMYQLLCTIRRNALKLSLNIMDCIMELGIMHAIIPFIPINDYYCIYLL